MISAPISPLSLDPELVAFHAGREVKRLQALDPEESAEVLAIVSRILRRGTVTLGAAADIYLQSEPSSTTPGKVADIVNQIGPAVLLDDRFPQAAAKWYASQPGKSRHHRWQVLKTALKYSTNFYPHLRKVVGDCQIADGQKASSDPALKDTLSLEETRLILWEAMVTCPHRLPPLVLMLFLGLEVFTICQLTWRMFDLSRQQLTIPGHATTNGKTWIIALPDELCCWLRPFVRSQAVRLTIARLGLLRWIEDFGRHCENKLGLAFTAQTLVDTWKAHQMAEKNRLENLMAGRFQIPARSALKKLQPAQKDEALLYFQTAPPPSWKPVLVHCASKIPWKDREASLFMDNLLPAAEIRTFLHNGRAESPTELTPLTPPR